MQLTAAVTGGRVIVAADGDLDVSNAEELRGYLHELIDTGATSLVIDLTGVGFLDSTALGVFVHVHKRLVEQGGGLGLVCPHPRLLRIFRVTVLDRVFAIHPSMADALG